MQGLHKKQTNTGTMQGYKHEKNNPSNRARLVIVAKKEINQPDDSECKCSACLIRDYGDHILES